jgi:uncharacterized membrane protein YcaP (DUF421 family)
MFFDEKILNDLLYPDISILEKIIRPIVVYIFLVIMLRLFGKRELAQLNPFDLVVLLCLSNTVQNAIIGSDNSLSGGIIGAFTLLSINYIVVRFLFKHRRLDQIFVGRETVLIKNGKLLKDALAKELLTEAELQAVAHRQGFRSLNEVETAILEPGGTFYIEGKTPFKEEKMQAELLAKIEHLGRQIEELKAART